MLYTKLELFSFLPFITFIYLHTVLFYKYIQYIIFHDFFLCVCLIIMIFFAKKTNLAKSTIFVNNLNFRIFHIVRSKYFFVCGSDMLE